MPRRRTWELPRVDGVDVDDGDDALDVVAEAVELVAEVETYQLLLRRVEAVPRGKAGGGHAGRSARTRTSRPAARWPPVPPPLGPELPVEGRLGEAVLPGAKNAYALQEPRVVVYTGGEVWKRVWRVTYILGSTSEVVHG